jgi:hypothetical protein
MTAATEAGSLYVERGAAFPKFLQFDSESSLNGWASIRNVRSMIEKQINKAGWVYFFHAGKIETGAFGFDSQRALDADLNRMARSVKSQKCNSFEIMDVTTRQFPGIFRVSVSAHARHFQEGAVCFGQ